jgi:hypothetical protein
VLVIVGIFFFFNLPFYHPFDCHASRCFKHDPPLLQLADELPTCASGDAGRQSLGAFATALKGCQNKVKLVGQDLEAAQEARKKELPLAQEDRLDTQFMHTT